MRRFKNLTFVILKELSLVPIQQKFVWKTVWSSKTTWKLSVPWNISPVPLCFRQLVDISTGLTYRHSFGCVVLGLKCWHKRQYSVTKTSNIKKDRNTHFSLQKRHVLKSEYEIYKNFRLLNVPLTRCMLWRHLLQLIFKYRKTSSRKWIYHNLHFYLLFFTII